jgi:hypothetical protein
MGTWGSFPGSRGVELTTHFHPVPRLRMVEIYLHFPIISMWRLIKNKENFTFT